MISIITAFGRNLEMGQDDGLPWGTSMKADAEWFKKHMKDSGPVIAGRKTFKETRLHFPDKEAYVVSRKLLEEASDNVHWIDDIHKLLPLQKSPEEFFCIGGGQINKLLLPFVKKLYLTRIDAEFPAADVYFPEFDANDYKIIYQDSHEADKENPYPYTFFIYQRNLPPEEL